MQRQRGRRAEVLSAGHDAFLRDAQSRVKAVLLSAKERTLREMAEMAARAILAGDDVEDLSFEHVEGMEGVEEAVVHILSGVYDRRRLEVRAEHERLWGEPPQQVPRPDEPKVEAEERTAPIAHDAVERYTEELERGVRKAVATVKANEGANLWERPKEEIADLICALLMPPGRTPEKATRERRDPGEADPGIARPDETRGITPRECLALGIGGLTSGGPRDEAAVVSATPGKSHPSIPQRRQPPAPNMQPPALIAELAVDDLLNESARSVKKAAVDAKGAPDLAELSKSQIADLLWAAVIVPEETPGGPQAQADEHVVRGNELEPGAAIEEYQKALAIDPNHVMAHFFLAEAFRNVGNLRAAVDEFSRVTRLAPNDPDGHWSLGDALYQSGQLQAAAREYACALKLAPNDESVLERYSMLSPGMKSIVRQQKALRPKPAQTG
jgi:hypothetical protein